MKELRPVQVILLGFFNYNICRIDTACTADRNTKRAGNALY